MQTLGIDDLQLLHAVCHAVLIELLQTGQIILAHANDQTAVLNESEIQILRQLGHHQVALKIHFRHQRAMLCVKAGMDNGAVGLGGAAAHVLAALHYADLGLVAGQEAGNGAAGHTGADDDDVIHVNVPPNMFVQ